MIAAANLQMSWFILYLFFLVGCSGEKSNKVNYVEAKEKIIKSKKEA